MKPRAETRLNGMNEVELANIEQGVAPLETTKGEKCGPCTFEGALYNFRQAECIFDDEMDDSQIIKFAASMLKSQVATPVETASPDEIVRDGKLVKCPECGSCPQEAANKIAELESQLTQVRSELTRLSDDFQSWLKCYESGELDSEELTQTRSELDRIVGIAGMLHHQVHPSMDLSSCKLAPCDQFKSATEFAKQSVELLKRAERAELEFTQVREELKEERLAHEIIADLLLPLVGTPDGTSIGAAGKAAEEITRLRSAREEYKLEQAEACAEVARLRGELGKAEAENKRLREALPSSTEK